MGKDMADLSMDDGNGSLVSVLPFTEDVPTVRWREGSVEVFCLLFLMQNFPPDPCFM